MKIKLLKIYLLLFTSQVCCKEVAVLNHELMKDNNSLGYQL